MTCSRYRPNGVAPSWVAEALARHEVAREAACAAAPGSPTREWPEAAAAERMRRADALIAALNGDAGPGRVPRGAPGAAIVARANGKPEEAPR